MLKRIARVTALILILAVFTSGALAVTADFGYGATGKTSKKVTKKISKKVIKTKKVAKKTYKKTKKITIKYGTKTIKNTSTQKVTQKKTVNKKIVTTAKQNQKKKIVKTVKTTTTYTTTTAKPAAGTVNTTTASQLKATVTPALANAFDKLGFTIKIEPDARYAGIFSTSKHYIGLQAVSTGVFRHEMGHFLSTLKNKAAKTSTFQAIYQEEKDKYTGTNKAYVTSTSDEYFAESYRNYLENGTKLKAERAKTYSYINEQATGITQEDITRTYNQYSWAW